MRQFIISLPYSTVEPVAQNVLELARYADRCGWLDEEFNRVLDLNVNEGVAIVDVFVSRSA